ASQPCGPASALPSLNCQYPSLCRGCPGGLTASGPCKGLGPMVGRGSKPHRFQEVVIMRFDFSPLFRSTVGFDRLFDTLDQVAQYDSGNGYPPYNIERSSENRYRISVAVAGFGEKDLNVQLHDGVLTISGKRDETEKSDGKGYLYQGIAGRAF